MEELYVFPSMKSNTNIKLVKILKYCSINHEIYNKNIHIIKNLLPSSDVQIS